MDWNFFHKQPYIGPIYTFVVDYWKYEYNFLQIPSFL